MTTALVILGSTISALAVARDARAHGLLPIIVDTRHGIACESYGTRVELLDASQLSTKELARVCALGGGGKHFLIATGDAWLRFVIAHRDMLESAFARVLHASNASLSTCLNKAHFAQWCRRHDVPAPRAWLAGREERPSEPMRLPVLLRPADTLHDPAVAAIPKAVQIASESALREWLHRYQEAGVEPLVTESLLGQPLVQYSVAVARAQGRTSSFVARKLRPGPEACAVGTCVELSPARQIESQVLGMLEALDYHGIAEVEVLHVPESGRSVVIEVNARPWLQYALAPASGHDFLGLLLGMPALRPSRLRKTGMIWLNLHDDLYVCWSRSLGMVRHGRLDLLSYLKTLWLANVYAVFDAGDLGPWWTTLRRRVTRTPPLPSAEGTATGPV